MAASTTVGLKRQIVSANAVSHSFSFFVLPYRILYTVKGGRQQTLQSKAKCMTDGDEIQNYKQHTLYRK